MTSYGLDEWFWAMFELTWTWPNFDFGNLCMCIGVNRWIFWKKSPNVVLTKIQNFIEIQSSRFRWYSFVFARTQSHLVSFILFYIDIHSIEVMCCQFESLNNILWNSNLTPIYVCCCGIYKYKVKFVSFHSLQNHWEPLFFTRSYLP